MNISLRFSLVLLLFSVSFPPLSRVMAESPSDGNRAALPAQKLTPFESSLIGPWFVGGNWGRCAFIAGAGTKLFSIDENRRTLELHATAGGQLVVKRGDRDASGLVTGDFILWSGGAWWSRHPVPEPIDVSGIWGDSEPGWVNLRAIAPVSMEGCSDFKRIVEEKAGSVVRGVTYSFQECIAAHAPGTIDYKFEKPITEFRSEVALGDGGRMGSVVFKVRTDAGVVFTSEEISHARGNVQRVELKFAPTKTLTLITEPGENNYEDWSAWLAPQIR